MTETPQPATVTNGGTRWARIPVNGTPAADLPQQDLVALLDGLEHRLASQPLIEQSKGILIGLFGIGPDTAFDLLRRWSSHTNLKIRDISQMLVAAATRGQRAEPGRANQELIDLIHCFNRALRGAPVDMLRSDQLRTTSIRNRSPRLRRPREEPSH